MLGKQRMELSPSGSVSSRLRGILVLGATVGLGTVVALGASGCRTTVRITDTPQTASEQLLLNTSVDAVARCIDFGQLSDRSVYLDAPSLDGIGGGYLVYRIREEMALSGVRLANSREEAEVIVEAGLAAYGTDSHNSIFGITETDQLPEINLCVRDTQYGVAKLSMFAVERETGAIIWYSGPMRADGWQRMRKSLGVGPIIDGTIEHPANRVR